MHVRKLGAAAAAGAMVAIGMAAVAQPAVAAPAKAKADKAPLIKLRGYKSKVTVSKSRVTAGVVRFNVARTAPGPDPTSPDTIDIFSSRTPAKALATIPPMFGDDAAAAAKAARTLNKIATLYGGANTGTTWEVNLPRGTYYAVSLGSAAAGTPLYTKFRVTGPKRHTAIHDTDASVRAVDHNVWRTRHLDRVGRSSWIQFANRTHEIHFMDLGGVKKGTTRAQIRKFFADPSQQPTFFTKAHFAFDVISPGVTVALHGPVKRGNYLLACFMPSQEDGTPHAFMGMWDLVKIG